MLAGDQDPRVGLLAPRLFGRRGWRRVVEQQLVSPQQMKQCVVAALRPHRRELLASFGASGECLRPAVERVGRSDDGTAHEGLILVVQHQDVRLGAEEQHVGGDAVDLARQEQKVPHVGGEDPDGADALAFEVVQRAQQNEVDRGRRRVGGERRQLVHRRDRILEPQDRGLRHERYAPGQLRRDRPPIGNGREVRHVQRKMQAKRFAEDVGRRSGRPRLRAVLRWFEPGAPRRVGFDEQGHTIAVPPRRIDPRELVVQRPTQRPIVMDRRRVGHVEGNRFAAAGRRRGRPERILQHGGISRAGCRAGDDADVYRFDIGQAERGKGFESLPHRQRGPGIARAEYTQPVLRLEGQGDPRRGDERRPMQADRGGLRHEEYPTATGPVALAHRSRSAARGTGARRAPARGAWDCWRRSCLVAGQSGR